MNKFTNEQCQHQFEISAEQYTQVTIKFEVLFHGNLSTWKMGPTDPELKENARLVCSKLYPGPKIQEEIVKK